MPRYPLTYGTKQALQGLLRGLTEGSKQFEPHAPRRGAFYDGRFARTAGLLRDQLWLAIRLFSVSARWGAVL